MKRSTQCDVRRLDLLLSDRLPQDRQRDAEAHLSGCPACQMQLEKLAGERRWWAEVRNHLGDDGDFELSQTSDHSTNYRRHRMSELSFLAPAENAGALGRLGNYDVLDVIGHGGMGIVLKGFDAALHRPVAIKVLAAPFTANGAARKRFAREAQAAAAVVHEHVVPVHAVDAEATPPYLVMAFISGRSLQQRIDESGPLEIKEILRIGMQAAAGLAAAHAQGLVHRDIKPANIMLENGVERVRITDFGLARAVDDASVSHSGTLAGTPQYMAPEQARGESVDQRADLFALGSTIYAMATGRPPFRGESGLAVLRQVSDSEPPPIQNLNPEAPCWLVGIIARLHAKLPEDRFQTAAEVAALLEGCLAHLQQPQHLPLPAAAIELGRRFVARPPGVFADQRRTILIVAATALLAFGALVAGWAFYWKPTTLTETLAAPSAVAAATIAIPDDAEIHAMTGRLRSALTSSAAVVQSATQGGDVRWEESIARIKDRVSELLRRDRSASNSRGNIDPIADGIANVRARLARLAESIAPAREPSN